MEVIDLVSSDDDLDFYKDDEETSKVDLIDLVLNNTKPKVHRRLSPPAVPIHEETPKPKKQKYNKETTVPLLLRNKEASSYNSAASRHQSAHQHHQQQFRTPFLRQNSIRIVLESTDNAILRPGILAPMTNAPTGRLMAVSCCHITQHIQQKDKWSCGYRNLQMLLSALLPHIPPHHSVNFHIPRHHDYITIPSIKQIQLALERAWRNGFDPNGARHFCHRLVGKHQWIGAVEVSSVLTFWGFDVAVIQFIQCEESRQILSRFVRAYFDKTLGQVACPFCSHSTTTNSTSSANGTEPATSSCVSKQLLHKATFPSTSSHLNVPCACDCPLLPMYLQWEGHSVTIVGVDGTDHFLVYDPQKKACSDKDTSVAAPTKLHIKKLQAKDTQVVMISSLHSLSSREQQRRKNEEWILTAAQSAVVRAVSQHKG